MQTTNLMVLCGLVVSVAGLAVAEDVNMLLKLDERANRPAEPWVPREDLEQVPAGKLLFSMVGTDNSECIRGVNDVTGDGVPEVMVGVNDSQVPNVFCLDGASRGTASVVWSHQTTTGVSGGAPYGDQAVVPASDADGNGFQNVLVGTAWGGRTAYSFDSLDGTVRWKFDTYLEPESGWVYSLAELDDITGDGVPEVAFGAGSYNDTLYVVDGASSGGLASQATLVWSYPAADAVMSVRNLGDTNGDGADDVLAAIGDDGHAMVCLSGAGNPPAASVLWTYPTAYLDSVWSCGVLPDVTGDGVNEALAVVWAADGSAIRCRNGANGAQVWTSTAVYADGLAVDAMADVTGDGKPEVVVSSYEHAVTVLSGADGSLVWKTPVGTLNGGYIFSARAIDDLDGDGLQDVIAGSADYYVYAMSGVDGTILWTYLTGNRVFSVAPLGDLNHDGRPEVGATTQDTNNSTVVYVFWGEPPTFADDFESGDTGAWTLTEP